LKSTHKKNLILVDADGVLLDWEYAFSVWMLERGWAQQPNAKDYYKISDQFENLDDAQAKKFTQLFNESAAIGFLPPLRDAMYYVKRLHEEHGYVFHCITSLSTDVNAGRLREMNLRKLFGKTAFEGMTCLATGADKTSALEPYAGSGLYWIEDKPENADLGHSLGLRSMLMEHGHNMNHECPYPVVKNWREIYAIITS
jgi:hypothetical protein